MGRKVSCEAAIAALVARPNIKEAASTCGISEKTLHAWLKEPEFSIQLAEAQRGVTKRVMRSVISRAERAVSVLDEIMSDSETAAPARVSAARTVLEFTMRAVELEDVLARIEALEAATEDSGR